MDQKLSANLETQDLLAEAEALATYVARHGDVLALDQTSTDNDRQRAYTEMLGALGAVDDNPSADNWQRLMAAYASVTAFTYKERGVNGRTVLDTLGKSRAGWAAKYSSARYRPLWVGIVLFLSALALELSAAWAGSISSPDTLGTAAKRFYDAIIALTPFLIPAVWGGIGSCIFLMKRLTDRLFELAYEESRVKGDGARIYLGAMLGVIIVVLFFPDYDQNIRIGNVNFGPATAAFLGGLGVKPIYAGFEALAEGLAKRVSGKEKAK